MAADCPWETSAYHHGLPGTGSGESAWEESPGGDALPCPGGTRLSHCLRVNYRSTNDLSQAEAITQGRKGLIRAEDSKHSSLSCPGIDA